MLLWQMAGKGKICKGSRLKSRVNDSSYFILTLFAITPSETTATLFFRTRSQTIREVGNKHTVQPNYLNHFLLK